MPRSSGKKADRPTGQPAVPKTPEQWDEFFFQVSRHGGNVTRACEVTRVSRQAVWYRARTDEEFKRRLDEAKELGADFLEDEAVRRAFEGVEEPVGFYMGVSNTVKVNYSDSLIQFLLKGLRPDKYKERAQVDGTRFNVGPREDDGLDYSKLSREELEQLGSLLSKAAVPGKKKGD